MSTTAKSQQMVIIAHVCSKCGAPLVQKVNLYAEGSANAFFHEKDMAQEARDKAAAQARVDIVKCYENPRMLGSYTDFPTDSNRTTAYYRLVGLDSACPTCGQVEEWQKGKKSMWNPMDVPFAQRPVIHGIPVQSRPVLLASEEAIALWMQDPINQVNIEQAIGSQGTPVQAQAVDPIPADQLWTCSKCKTENPIRIQTCQGCGVTKAWSDSQAAKKKK